MQIRTDMMKMVLRCLLILMLAATSLQAQRGFGFRFASNFNHFATGDRLDLIDGGYSTVVVGPYYQAYFSNGGWQAGINFVGKGNKPNSFNLPVVMRDYNGDHNVGVTALEFDLKVGPRFGIVSPKIGYIAGYRFKQEGILDSGKVANIRDWYINLPFGLTVDLPTDYGSVGFGVHYLLGMTGVMKRPDNHFGNWNSSSHRAFNVELFIMFKSGDQSRPKPPPPPQ